MQVGVTMVMVWLMFEAVAIKSSGESLLFMATAVISTAFKSNLCALPLRKVALTASTAAQYQVDRRYDY
jgi:hypothetical protein